MARKTPRSRVARRGQNAASTRDGAVWIYGRHAVAAALANPRRTCHLLLVTDEARSRLDDAPDRTGLRVESADRAAIARQLEPRAVHQGLALRVAPLPEPSLARIADGSTPILILDQVTDPQNVGAMLRTAAAFGIGAVVVQARNSPPLTGTLAKAAAGALETVPVVHVTNLARTVADLKDTGYRAIGLDAAATHDVFAIAGSEGVALVMGAEGKGLRRLVRESCDELVRIPIADGVESLNVSVACGIALCALARARRAA